MTQRLDMRLLGKPQLHLNNHLLDIKSIKAQALLFYLALNPRAHSRESLAGLLWGAMPEEMARSNLRKVVTVLRRSVGDHLDIQRRELRFLPSQYVTVDVTLFEQQADSAESISLYRANFLQDFVVPQAAEFDLWLLGQRERLRMLMLQRLQSVTARLEAAGDLNAALQHARRWLELGPWEERAHRHVMALLAQTDRRAEALKQFERCQQLLQDELGVSVSAETSALHQQILNNAFATPLIIPHNLPNPATPLVGRSADLATIHETLAHPDCRLITLLGHGGIGKSRLAIAAAHAERNNDSYAHGIYFVPLAAAPDRPTLLTTIAETLAIQLRGNRPALEQIRAYLGERSWLLVLDNFEQLTDCAAVALDLLTSCPNLTLLVTSRTQLELFEEWVIEVDRLDPQAAFNLFSGHAQRWSRGFSAENNATHITHICQLTDGIPLALELAAARTRQQSCAVIADQIADSLDYLRTQSPSLPLRQRTLRAVFEDSWRLLNAQQQPYLAQLAVFRDGFSAAAASAIVGCDAGALADLSNRSLLHSVADGRYLMHDMVRGFSAEKLTPQVLAQTKRRHSDYFSRWLDSLSTTIRAAGEQASITAIVTNLANVRSGFEWALSQPDGQPDGYNLMLQMTYLRRSWYDDGRQLFADALANLVPRTDKAAQQKTLGLLQFSHGEFLSRLGQKSAAIDWFKQAAEALIQQSVWFETALVYGEWASALVFSGKHAEAQACIDLALAAAAKVEVAQTIAHVANALRTTRAQIAMHNNDFVAARTLFQEALRYADSIGHVRNVAVAHNNIATAELHLGNLASARTHEQRALAMARQLDEPLLVGIDAKGLGDILLRMGEIDSAEKHLDEALTIFRKMKALRWQTTTLITLGTLHRQNGDYAQSADVLNEAMTIAEREQLRPDWLNARFEFGRLLQDQGRSDQAAALFRSIVADDKCSQSQKDHCLAALKTC